VIRLSWAEDISETCDETRLAHEENDGGVSTVSKIGDLEQVLARETALAEFSIGILLAGGFVSRFVPLAQQNRQ
jgi:hypothetical protein